MGKNGYSEKELLAQEVREIAKQSDRLVLLDDDTVCLREWFYNGKLPLSMLEREVKND